MEPVRELLPKCRTIAAEMNGLRRLIEMVSPTGHPRTPQMIYRDSEGVPSNDPLTQKLTNVEYYELELVQRLDILTGKLRELEYWLSVLNVNYPDANAYTDTAVIRHIYGEGLTHAATAAAMSCDERTVRRWQERAIRKMEGRWRRKNPPLNVRVAS
jgi:hypothetical protein